MWNGGLEISQEDVGQGEMTFLGRAKKVQMVKLAGWPLRLRKRGKASIRQRDGSRLNKIDRLMGRMCGEVDGLVLRVGHMDLMFWP